MAGHWKAVGVLILTGVGLGGLIYYSSRSRVPPLAPPRPPSQQFYAFYGSGQPIGVYPTLQDAINAVRATGSIGSGVVANPNIPHSGSNLLFQLT